MVRTAFGMAQMAWRVSHVGLSLKHRSAMAYVPHTVGKALLGIDETGPVIFLSMTMTGTNPSTDLSLPHRISFPECKCKFISRNVGLWCWQSPGLTLLQGVG